LVRNDKFTGVLVGPQNVNYMTIFRGEQIDSDSRFNWIQFS